jgi:heterodisulfide reductase subunit B
MSDRGPAEQSTPKAKPVGADLARRVLDETGQNVNLCYQCVKCTSGCPLAEFFDWQPNQVMRAVQLGDSDIALGSETTWLCAACQTCTTRCPQGIDVAAVMEFLTREALAQGIKPAVPEVPKFDSAFLREIRLWRRAYELGLMAELKLRTGRLTQDIDLGLRMLAKRKMPLLPKAAPRKRPKPVEGAATSVAYYPGCSLHSTATEFDVSARAVAGALDLELIEPEGWVCCGSSAAHRADPEVGRSLPLENLALVEQGGFSEVTMPCASCFSRHKIAQYQARQGTDAAPAGPSADGDGSGPDAVRVTTFIETITRNVEPELLAERVERPLTGLRAVCYYGCLLTRPPEATGAEHPENPADMDRLMSAVGVEVLDWSYKTACCGAANSLTRPDIVLRLSGDLIDHAKDVGAEAVVVACPLCHMNLDARQTQMDKAEPLPVLYFTQLMALALGLPDEAALHKNLVDPRPLMREKGFIPLH